jgi:hypothetical protein
MYSCGYTCIRSSPLNIVVKFVCAFWQTDIFIDFCESCIQICMRCAAEPIYFGILAPGIPTMFFLCIFAPPARQKKKFVCANLMYSCGYTCIRSSPLNIVVKFVCAFWQTDNFIDFCESCLQICMRCAAEPIYFGILALGIPRMFFLCIFAPLPRWTKK